MNLPSKSVLPEASAVHVCQAAVLSPRQQQVQRLLYDRHRSMLIISLIVLALSFVISIREAHVSWLNIDLPVLCGSRALFDVECPGCGLTRSFVALADGNWASSFEYHRVGWLMFLAVLLQVPYRAYRLWQLRAEVLEPQWPRYFGYLLIAALIGNWAWNVVS